jgi:glutaminyl-peptide cyclotransferase
MLLGGRRWWGHRVGGVCLIALVLTLAGCSVTLEAQGDLTQLSVARPAVAYIRPEIVEVRNHDATSYTQGLLLHEGVFFESGGLYQASSLRKVDPKTGEVLKRIEVPPQYFAEGLALVGDRLIQLTWQEQVAFVYNVNTFEKVGEFSYEGEGWGLCYDGEELYMSNGSANLTVRDPQTFAVRRVIPVTLFDDPVPQLNELECVGGHVYANIYQTDTLVQIEKFTGRVSSYIDAARLLNDAIELMTPQQIELLGGRGVLNGIAYDPQTRYFYITGKLWPVLFVVSLDGR